MNEIKFGNWLVLGEGTRSVQGRRRLVCRCRCGIEREVQLNSLISGESRGCGHCRDKLLYNGTTIPHSGPIYFAWYNMRRRCFNSDFSSYRYYGGRGITVCDRWLIFENFYADMIASWKTGLSIDRIDNDGNYCPENCKWSTSEEQMNNTRRVVHYSAYGKTMNISQWERYLGTKRDQVRYLVSKGWEMEDIVDRFTSRQPKQ